MLRINIFYKWNLLENSVSDIQLKTLFLFSATLFSEEGECTYMKNIAGYLGIYTVCVSEDHLYSVEKQ